ncbi:hypothetical protein DPMN_085737 [Dreissena polymorpha]|uniref:Lipase domain-containing protein n=1 Tax=Dreissena polymorpha TaxID=45954 RepID=A0A9D3YCW5_DREPO|nr:hypothetical protein DPMN_085737 [Dreissena polymorpha]
MAFSCSFQVKFLLYTRANTQSPQIVTKTSDSIQASHFSRTRKTKFIIHGYQDRHGQWMSNMAQAIIKRVKSRSKERGLLVSTGLKGNID